MKRTWLILSALIIGLTLGILSVRFSDDSVGSALDLADTVGGLWLDALRMTIIPLVVSLLVTGIAKTFDCARGDKVALRSVVLFIALLWLSTAMAALLIPSLLAAWPVPEAAAKALAASLGHDQTAPAASPGIADFFRSIVPTNPVAAAANNALLPLILFTAIFAMALARLPAGQREPVVGFFEAIGNAMLIVVDWVLKAAPVGVLALAFAVGARAGASAIGALVHYVLIVSSAGLAAWLLAYPLAGIFGKVGLVRFARALLPAQAVALSTQSSLASLPTMLSATAELGIRDSVARVSLPIAVAIFRVTSPAMNLGVAIYVAHWMGIDLSASALFAGAAVAAVTTVGSVSLPGQVSFLTSITPICVAMGVPIEPLALLVAVEMIPDLVRTVGNVTMDVAATSVVDRLENTNNAIGQNS
ncbi:cation:dicarboxylase symporter family transporter [Niveispirillum sp.]|uniref:dicarboxylate/amino acid:cation symporter n=1 Tax=Niveispirillum sp. TaxID=1917217 RepID=UPI001B5A6490|nr:cation:dicarboxylase symporter family transporter [Niveispirillum sp.]MBP7338547.1 cation:dicarboxylase symporter family transporter [Niveispirillum sp.]